MTSPHTESSEGPNDGVTDFFARLPSTQWEQVSLGKPSGSIVWCWFKPVSLPQGLAIQISDAAFVESVGPVNLTMRRILCSAGVDPAAVAFWNFCGVAYDAMRGASPILDQPIPRPPAGTDPNLTVAVHAPLLSMPQPAAVTPMAVAPMSAQPLPTVDAPITGDSDELFDDLQLNWHAIIQMEKQLVAMRMKLSALLGRLTALNRDLSPEERLLADRQQKSDWQIARRWLRDVAKRVSQSLKEYDIGERSAAGKRNWLLNINTEYVVPRKNFDGIHQAQREFETHRKMVQTLQMTMNNSLQTATQDGERRAQQILGKIAVTVRAAQSRR